MDTSKNPRLLMRIAIAAALSISLIIPLRSTLALAKVTVSFVMINPITGKNAGASAWIILNQVNRAETKQARTNSSGVATFSIEPVDYILTSLCSVCFADGSQTRQGTQYLIQPQPNGSVVVKSAADETMTKDSSGRWKISAIDKRAKLSSDPWKTLSNIPTNLGTTRNAFLLTDGRVVVMAVKQNANGQGWRDHWWVLSPDLAGHYSSATWAPIASLQAGYNPITFNGAVLHDGNLLIAGGEANSSASGVFQQNVNMVSIYNPTKNTWTSVVPPDGGSGDWEKIGASPFVELADGSVMIGHNEGPTYSVLFNPRTSLWTRTGLNKQSENIEQGYTLLQNDKILDIDSSLCCASTMSEIYDPASGSWTAGPDVPAVLGHSEIGPAVSLPNGKVLATGATGHNALYDPFTNSWSTVPDFPHLNNGLQLVAADNPAGVLPNGNVLVATSIFTCSTQNCSFMAPQQWFEYDWVANTWNRVPDLPFGPASSTLANESQLLVLPTGELLAITYQGLALYSGTGGPSVSWAPAITDLPVRGFHPGAQYTLTGTQLAGLTQGSFWGDESQNATNYGLVQIQNIATGHKYYARAFDYTSTSIAPAATSTLSFELNGTVENGPSRLRVIANGIASAPEVISVSGYAPKIARKGSISLKSLAAGLGLTVPAGATVTGVVASSSSSICSISSGTVNSKGLKAGSCAVTITIQAKKPPRGPAPAPVKGSISIVVR